MWKYLLTLGLNQLEQHPELIEKLISIITTHLSKAPTPTPSRPADAVAKQALL